MVHPAYKGQETGDNPLMTKYYTYAWYSLDDPRFQWLLNTEPGWQQTPRTHKDSGSAIGVTVISNGQKVAMSWNSPGSGVTRAHSGLLSRRGYVRIIREGISATQLDAWAREAREIAGKVLSGFYALVFERLVWGPILNGVQRPTVRDLALQYGRSEKKISKILRKCEARVRAEKERRTAEQEKEQAMDAAVSFSTMRRQTGGITYQHDGRFWDDSQLARSSNYSTSINSAATSVSSSNKHLQGLQQ